MKGEIVYCLGFWVDKLFMLKVYDQHDCFVTSSSFDNYYDFCNFYNYVCVLLEVDRIPIRYSGTTIPKFPEFKPSAHLF